MDTVSAATRSNIMRAVRSRNSRPEMKVRKALHAAGFRFRLHNKKLPGTPDIALTRYKTIVFINGCLWHWHGCERSRMPASNQDYWTTKIARNVQRDHKNMDALRAGGWKVKIVWECELQSATEELLSDLMAQRSVYGQSRI